MNVEISNKGGIRKINIVDVLKPADDSLAELEEVEQPHCHQRHRANKSASGNGTHSSTRRHSADTAAHSSGAANHKEEHVSVLY